jgi:hypothetical protein
MSRVNGDSKGEEVPPMNLEQRGFDSAIGKECLRLG